MFNIKQVLTQGGRNKILYLLITLVLLVVLDGLLTEYLMDGGGVSEANPFLEPLVGETGFMILKIVGALLVALILWDVYRRFPRVGVIATWIAVIGYFGIVIWNTSLVFLV
jgi:hypothetical protein